MLVLYYNYTLLIFFFILRYFLLCHLKTKPHPSSLWSCSCCSSSVFAHSSFFLWHLSGSFQYVISFSTRHFPFSFILETFQGIKSFSSPKTCVLIYWAAQIILRCFELVYLCNFYYYQALNRNMFQAIIKCRWKKNVPQ